MTEDQQLERLNPLRVLLKEKEKKVAVLFSELI